MKRKHVIIFLSCVILASSFIGCTNTSDSSDTDILNAPASDFGVNSNNSFNQGESSSDTAQNSSISEEYAETSLSDNTNNSDFSSLDEEILAVEKTYQELKLKLSNADTQLDMNFISNDVYSLWDDELNSLWKRFSEAASEELKNEVLAEQRAWISKKEDCVKEAGEAYEGGSIRPLIENNVAADLTRERCYILANYLAEATNEAFTLEIPLKAQLEFVDRQGTVDSIYSSLSMSATEGNDYYAVISIYKLCELKGDAIMDNDDVYQFTDNTMGITGTIRILDGCTNATFEVAESNAPDLIPVGAIYEFPETR